MASMSPCTIEKDVLDAMKKFRRLSNKSTMAMLLRCDMKTNQVVIDKELKVSAKIKQESFTLFEEYR
ncbi:unnamed protein product [Rotaria sp. Silwood2]|nr:unnamed protein product [Rotaria sp. Silwood2]